MSLQPHPIDPVPDDTAHLAATVYRTGHPYIRLRDTLGTIYDDTTFACLYPTRGQPAFSPWRLMLITILQYAEELSDRQAAAATRDRIDWKYVLSLPLGYEGFDASVLSEFRTRLVEQDAAALILDPMLARFRALGLLTGRHQQRTDSTHVLAAVRRLNRLEVVGETMRHALNVLAVAAPEWLQQRVPSNWIDRYGPRVEAARLVPKQSSMQVMAQQIGQDGQMLLAAMDEPDAPAGLRALPAIRTLRTVWEQQYYEATDPTVRWRADVDLPPAADLVHSPYDPEARYTRKRQTAWVGYKVHLTETCAPDCPRVITSVLTTAPGIADCQVTNTVHDHLAARDLLPSTHLMDAGYVDGPVLVDGHRRGVEVVGPVAPNGQWQARANRGYDADAFALDWTHEYATCPAGQRSASWARGVDHGGTPVITIGFGRATCGGCAVRTECTRASHRTLTVRSEEVAVALRDARARQGTAAFRKRYALRAGVEGTIAQGVAVCGLHHARYIGTAKTHLQHLSTAAALNLLRVAAWLAGDSPATTRCSPFQSLMAPN